MAEDRKRGWVLSHDALSLGAILIVAALVRGFAWSRTTVLFNDGPVFLAMAKAVREGDWADILTHPYHPLYSILIAIVSRLPIELESAGVLVSMLGGLVAIAAIFYFVRDTFGRDFAWIAAGIVALHPAAVDFSADVMSDGLYLGIFLVAFAAMVRMVSGPTLANALTCGVASGLAYLVRPEGAGLLISGVILLGVRGFIDPVLRRQSVLAAIGLSLAGLLAIVPFVVAVESQTGQYTLTQKKSLSNLITDDRGSEETAAKKRLQRTRMALAIPMPEVSVRSDAATAERPGRNAFGVIDAMGRMLSTSMSAFRYELLPLVVIGFLASRSRRDLWRDSSIALTAALYSGLLGILVWGAGYVSRRHALPALMPFVGFAAMGVRFLWTAEVAGTDGPTNACFTRSRGLRVVGMVSVVALLVSWGERDLRLRRDDRAPVRAAAEWLAEHHPDSGPVAAQKLRTAYYADARFVPLSSGIEGNLDAHLRRRGARWIIIDASKLDDHHGLRAGLSEADEEHPENGEENGLKATLESRHGPWLRTVHTVSQEGRDALVLSIEQRPAS